MKTKTFSEIFSPELAKDAIINNEFPGFREDYLTLHCLLQTFNPASVLEIGTNMGVGTNIICNALHGAKVYSLDLPTEQAHKSLQHPISEGKGDKVGSQCKRPYTQLRGDSLTFNFASVKCEAYFIDGEHTMLHVAHETKQAVKCKAKLIVWHDADIPEVWEGINKGISNGYDLYRVTDTRIAFAVLKPVKNAK